MKSKMNKKNLSLLVITLFQTITFNVYSQKINFNSNILIGKWDSYKVTTIEGGDGKDVTFDGKPFNKKLMIDFIDANKMSISINNSERVKISYQIKDSIIKINHYEYKIKLIKQNQLVLLENWLLGNLIYLRKEE